MTNASKLMHDIMNEFQAVDGFLELAPESPQLRKARAELKEVFRCMRRLRKILDANEPNGR